MSKLIRRLLSLLFTLGFYDKHYKIVWDGEIVSTNKFYEARHWTVRSGYKVKFAKIFEVLLLGAKVKPMKEISVVTFYNNRMDADNLSIMSKMLVDTMKGKYIHNDGNKFFKMTLTVYDENLPKGTAEFHIIGK
jgi:hypothetical protein